MMKRVDIKLASLAAIIGLALSGCSGDDGKNGTDGEPGKDGNPGIPVATDAKALTVAIDNVVVGPQSDISFTVTNEKELPVVGLEKFGFILSGLEQGTNGDASDWSLLSSESCPASKYAKCGSLTDNGDGSYSYRFEKDVTAESGFAITDEKTLRLVLRTGGEAVGQAEVAYANTSYDFRGEGEAALYSKNVVNNQNCAGCHDDFSIHGGKYTEVETCVSCHTDNKVSDASKVFPMLAHDVHIGVISAPVGGCDNCHSENEQATDFANWKMIPTQETCITCHADVDFKEGVNHWPYDDNTQCANCHTPEVIENVHLSTYQGQNERRSNLHLSVTDAKMVSAPEAEENKGKPGSYVQLTIDILDKDGKSRNEQLDKVKYLYYAEFYINWGGQDQGLGYGEDVADGRGKVLRVHTNKGPYPGYSEKPIVLNYENGKTTYEIGPFDMNDKFKGDISDLYGTVSPRIWFCMDATGENIMDCDGQTDWSNGAAGYNWLEFFNTQGLMEERPRRQVVTNELCGDCHGTTTSEDGFVQMTLNCRNCHSKAGDGEFHGTTCVSGSVDSQEQILLKKMMPRGERDWTTASNAAEECMACHNANVVPTQVIRDAHTKQGDKDYIEQLTMSHPDQKVWIHAMHANNRANQSGEGWRRNVEYSADLANCAKCHVKDSYDAKFLVGRKPLALDLDYMDTYTDPTDPINGRYAVDGVADAYVSPTAAVCLSCHGKRAAEEGEDRRQVRSEVVAHMKQNGAQFGVTLDEYNGEESCAVCHNLNNLKEVHGQK
ncbi:OmcA/MtrC family decaheme c-type cytochrome [uncultured Shewanella sp.]|uniref:OmcA/MtrC family decaheme c-type cytochrome n=1 Tax=uncultured Shewanella sp. TaxID=173975 RepID=UPI00261D6E34|nr:OmcA/MtrC family decaheme c-type cytochrome [uncultured Shewanella sp.]